MFYGQRLLRLLWQRACNGGFGCLSYSEEIAYSCREDVRLRQTFHGQRLLQLLRQHIRNGGIGYAV